VNKFKHYLKVFSIAFCVLALVGCGSSSSSSSSSDDSGAVTVLGSTEVSGSVSASNSDLSQAQGGNLSGRISLLSGVALQQKIQLTKQAMSLMEGSISSVADEVTMSGGRVYVSVVDSEGNITTTNVYAEIDSNGDFDLELKEGQTYILKGIQFFEDSDGNINKVETERIVRVDSTDTSLAVTVQPGMDDILKTLVSRLEETGMSEKKLKSVISTVAENFDQLLASQDITIGSSLETVFTSSEAEEAGITLENIYDSGLANVVDTELDSNEQNTKARLNAKTEVKTLFKEAERTAKAEKSAAEMSENERKDLIRAMFGVADGGSSGGSKGKSGGGTNIPDFYISNFADAYANGLIIEMTTFAEAWKLGFPSEELTAEQIAEQFTTSMNAVLTEMYDIYDAGTTTRSSTAVLADRFFGGDYDSALNAVTAFPEDDRLELPLDPDTFSMNSLQAILAFGITGLFERTESEDFDPIAFTMGMGVVNLESNSVYLTESRVRPIRMWIPEDFSDFSGQWTQVDALDIEAEIIASDLDEEFEKVVFVYTNTDGDRSVVELTVESEEEGGDARITAPSSKVAMLSLRDSAGAKNYNSKIVSQEVSAETVVTNRYRISPWDFHHDSESDGSNIISDFAEGDVSIQVWGDTDGDEVLLTKTLTLYKFNVAPPTWTFPEGPDMEVIREQGWDPDFDPQYIAIPEGRSSVSPRLEWEHPTVDLPEGFRLAYSVNLGLQVFRKDHSTALGDTSDLGDSWDWEDENGYGKWKHIWDTWEDDELVFDNFVILPDSVQLTETLSSTDPEKNYQATYELNIRPVIVDEDGIIVSEGDESRTNFKVGTPPVSDYSLTGTVTFPSTITQNMSHLLGAEGMWKIGLFKDGSWVEGEFTHVLHNSENSDPRTPISVDGTPLVYELGDMDAVTASFELSYTLPTFSSDDGVLARFEEAQLMVWFDRTVAPTSDERWESVTLTDDEVNVYTDSTVSPAQSYMIEENSHFHNARIRAEDGGLVIDTYDESTDRHRRLFLEDTDNQTINGEVFKWWYNE
jgi:hypothetical protein